MVMEIPYLFLPHLGVPELLIIAVLVLVIFGPGKLPEVFRSLGDGIRQFKKASHDVTGSSENADDKKSDSPSSSQ